MKLLSILAHVVVIACISALVIGSMYMAVEPVLTKISIQLKGK